MMKTISSILVANRGEIACRIMRTVQSMGIKAIAVYSDADKNAPHIKMADQAIDIGAAPVNQSYLVAENIINAAKEAGADAVHPGYGFLSENTDFAHACAANDIIFIGPSPEAIEIMGNKAAAKERMIKSGVPCVPGYNGADQGDKALVDAANAIGFPIMVKASAGGGGRGMRLVENKDDLPDALQLARSEAENAFGNGHLILERAIINPSHIEIQIFGDQRGNIIHFGERDCSVQRRHQKVLEEAPSLKIDSDLRREMGQAAINAAQSVDYVGAGTVEFLVDTEQNFYFLEMNTRLQVEHPVSELAYDRDFVELQIHIASGSNLSSITPDNAKTWAIEARVYCEDPENEFLPATGLIDFWRSPKDEGIRVDSGVETGSDVSPFYDSMIAKIIGHGETRDIARARLEKALRETCLFGPKNNLGFLIECVSKETFKTGPITTAFIENEFNKDQTKSIGPHQYLYPIASIIEHELNSQNYIGKLKNWTSTGHLTSRSQYRINDVITDLLVKPINFSKYEVMIEETVVTIKVDNFTDNDATLTVNSERLSVAFHKMGEGDFWINVNGYTKRITNLIYQPPTSSTGQTDGNITAPMHGLLLELKVKEGDCVKEGQSLATLEAMKMQHEIKADITGTIKAVHGKSGQQVAADTLLIEIEKSEAKDV
jgi:geranyl-CoA carboxylase alpha subunit